jgi:NitT/TauT family transport system ATP-binding protein
MLTASLLTKCHKPGDPVLRGVDLALGRDETLAVVGPSGCGKTTLLYLLAGLTRPDEGEVLLDGEPVTAPRADISIILQDYGLLPWRTVLENVALGLKIRGVSRSERRERARAQLAELGISGRDADYPAQLSGGEKQRVAIARAYVSNPRLLLMDEPFSSLDALTREKLQRTLLATWASRRVPYLLVTHSLEEAVYLGKRIAIMAGRPSAPARVFENPGFGSPDHRQTDAYFHLLTELRRAVEELW